MQDRIDHIAIVVDHLGNAQTFLETVMNMALVRELVIPERNVRVAFYQCGAVQIELIEVTEPGARTQRLGDAKARLEHVAIQVGNIRESMARLEGHGVQMASPPQFVGGRLAASTVPASSMGVMFQLLEEPAEAADS
jgi:catechol 2,3-dioxygenase-like lactoylglutathione lyase family enzyme